MLYFLQPLFPWGELKLYATSRRARRFTTGLRRLTTNLRQNALYNNNLLYWYYRKMSVFCV